MATHLRWGILATGTIAHAFASGLKQSRTGTLAAVCSRSLQKAQDFTAKHGGRPYDSIENFLADPGVDAVYIASPHHLHEAHTIACARAGKGILCEKPFTLSRLEAESALPEVRDANVFFMEAFMVRCHPQAQRIRALVAEGALGDVRVIRADFSFHVDPAWENFRLVAAHGGGGLMDVGVYCVQFANMVAGGAPTRAEYVATRAGDGYDAWGSGILQYTSGTTAHFGCGVHQATRTEAWVHGTKGHLRLLAPWFMGAGIEFYENPNAEPVWRETFESAGDLYALEADAVAASFEAKQSPLMTWQDTLDLAQTIDELKASAGLTFGRNPEAG